MLDSDTNVRMPIWHTEIRFHAMRTAMHGYTPVLTAPQRLSMLFPNRMRQHLLTLDLTNALHCSHAAG